MAYSSSTIALLIRTMVRLWLESNHRFEVCGEASDGAEGIEKALQLKPDLIVLDLSMPAGNERTASCNRSPVGDAGSPHHFVHTLC